MSTKELRRVGYTNVVLTVIAVCLGLLVVDRFSEAPEAEAQVQTHSGSQQAADPKEEPGRGAGLISAADQRKQMIAELKKLSAKVDALDKSVQAGLTVKVSEMPEITLPRN